MKIKTVVLLACHFSNLRALYYLQTIECSLSREFPTQVQRC